MRTLFVIVLLGLLSSPVTQAAAPQLPGYVAVIAKDEFGNLQLVRLTEIARAPRQRASSATRGWGVAVYDAGNRVLWQTHVVNPLNTAGRTVEAGAPIAGLTFANLPGAVRAALLDPEGNALLQVNLGAQERSTARKNGEQLRQRMLDSGNTRTISLSRSAPSSDAAARASALKQVDFNARQRERLPRCNDAAPVIPEEANMRALTRSPDCNATVLDEATALASASVASQKSPATGVGPAGADMPDQAVADESLETSELDLVNATLVFQGASGETISTPFTVMRHLSNGKEHLFTADAMGSVTVPVERGKPMSLFVYPPAPWLWGSFYPEPVAQDKDFTLVTKMVDSVPLGML